MKQHPTSHSRRLRRFQTGHRFGPFIAVCLLALSLFAPAAFAQETGSVNGHVLDDSTGKYLEGAEITVRETGQRLASARAGTFTVTGLAPGSYTLLVAYPGLEEKTETVAVAAGQIADLTVRLTSEEVITLNAVRVSGTKEGMAQAVALQKLSLQSKLVAAADQFGPISEGNVGEYLKYLPGLSIDYNANDARGVSLRGLNTSFTVVAVDGTPMAASSSVADTRRFEFEQIAMNNVETTELYKTITPDIPASSTGGFVNFVTKSAFDRVGTTLFSYDVNLVVPSTNFSTGKESGVWGNGKEYTVRPNLDLNLSRRIGEKIGINFNYRFSERYDDSPRTEINWAQSGAAAANFWTAPVMEQYNIRTEQKLTHREAFATKLDYQFTEATKLTLAGQWNWYDLHFHQRGPLLRLSTAGSRSGDAANPSFTSGGTQGTGGAQWGINNDVLFRNKYGTTLHFNGTLSHSFAEAGKVWATAYWSHADGQYRDLQKGFLGSTAVLNSGLITGFTLRNATTQELPAVELFNGATPVALDTIRSLSNYTLSSGANVVSRPWTTNETKTGFAAHYRVDLPGLEAVPVSLQTGVAVDKTERDITRLIYRSTFTSVTGAAIDALRDEGFTKDLAFGFGPYQVVDPYKTAAAFGNTLGTYFQDQYREFTEDNTAAYLRADIKPLADLLLIGGVRWEEHTIDGFAVDRAAALSKPAPVNLKYDRFYPSLSFKYTPAALKGFVARGGVSRTVGHPDYADLIGTVTLESSPGAQNGSLTQISPGIQPYYTTNYDLNFEFYMKNSGVVSMSVFRKNVENFIVRRGMTQAEINAGAAAAGVSAAQFTSGSIMYNGPDSSVQGLELGYAQTLSFLPKPFNGLNLQANFTVSDIDGDNNDVLWAQQRGAAPKTFNFVIGYRYGKWAFTTSTNWTDKTVASGLVNSEWIRGVANTTNTALDTQMVSIKNEVWRTDMKLEYAFSQRYRAYFAVQNVFGEGRDDYWQGYLPERSSVTLARNHYQFGEPYLNVGIRGTF